MSISVRLRPEAEARLANAVVSSGKPRNAIINEAIVSYLKDYDDKTMEREIERQCRLANEADQRDDWQAFIAL